MLAVPAGGFEQLCSLLQAVGGSEVQLRSRERDCTVGDVGASRCVTHLGLQGRIWLLLGDGGYVPRSDCKRTSKMLSEGSYPQAKTFQSNHPHKPT